MLNLDSNTHNADWIKTLHWDLPTDFDDFLNSIGGPTQLADFMKLPAAEAMPKEMRFKAEALLSKKSISFTDEDLQAIKGGQGSGNFNHQGRPGEQGGSGEGMPSTAVHGTLATSVDDIFKEGIKLGKKWNKRPKSVYFVRDPKDLGYFVDEWLGPLAAVNSYQNGEGSYHMTDGRVLSVKEFKALTPEELKNNPAVSEHTTLQYAQVKFKIPDAEVIPDDVDNKKYGGQSFRIEKPVPPENILSVTVYEKEDKLWFGKDSRGLPDTTVEKGEWKPVKVIEGLGIKGGDFGYVIVPINLSKG